MEKVSSLRNYQQEDSKTRQFPMFKLKLTPFAAAFIAATLIILITLVLPVGFKTWFVQETGNIKILPAIGPILAIAILLQRPVRKIAIAFFAIGLLFSLVSLFRAEVGFQAGYAFLAVLHIFLLWVLTNNSLKQYLDSAKPIETGPMNAKT